MSKNKKPAEPVEIPGEGVIIETKTKKGKVTKSEDDLKKSKRKKRIIIIAIIVLVLAIAAGAVYLIFFTDIFKAKEETKEEPVKEVEVPKIYSRLSGLEIADESENSKPVYCMQMPNDTYGARPQVGLDEAAVVFEAVAEGGITRFAAVFQNPKSEAIGPIRSMRPYYIDWDTPFDCTLVHAGGSYKAIAKINAGGYRDLSESAVYMWRDYSAYAAPDNLFTSNALLENFARDNNYSTSEPQVFSRLTPKEADEAAKSARIAAGLEDNGEEKSEGEEKSVTPLVENIQINVGYTPAFNSVYKYDQKSNTYLRSYASGEDHITYSCAGTGKSQPAPKADCGQAKQVAPSAVVAMMVDIYADSDDTYYNVVQTIGTGHAYIFQNGTVIRGTWRKISQSAQIEFTDESGNTVSFTPSQVWITAVPNSGGTVKY